MKWEVALFAGWNEVVVIARGDNLQKLIGQVLKEYEWGCDSYDDPPEPADISITSEFSDKESEEVKVWDRTTKDWEGDFAIMWIQGRINEPAGYIRKIG